MAALGARDRRHPALHRVHGRRPFERLAPRRGRPGRGDRRRDRGAIWPVEPAEPAYRGEVAGRWRYLDGGGEFGVISSVTQPFCRDCTRARISAEGMLYTCLFAVEGHDLRGAAALRRDGRGPRRAIERSGCAAATATRSSARGRRRRCRRSRCSRWAADRASSPACVSPQAVHSGGQVVDGDEGPPREFVDNRVDRPAAPARNVGLARRGRQDRGTRDHIKDVRSAAGRFGRFVATPGCRLTTIAWRAEPDGT